MSLSQETRDFLSRLNYKSNANKREVQRVLERAKEVRIRSFEKSCENGNKSNQGSQPWGARKEEEVEDALNSRKKATSYKAPKRIVATRDEREADHSNFKPGRKPAHVIQQEVEALEEHKKTEPRPLGKFYNRGNPELEKTRLQLQFQFKGGKALPTDALPHSMEGNIPLHLITRSAPRAWKTKGEENSMKKVFQKRQEIETLENSFDEVMKDIDKKKRALERAQNPRAVASIRSELTRLVDDTKNIHSLIEEERRELEKLEHQ